MLAGCSESTPPVGTIGHVTTYFGGVAAEEPRAALVARDVLSAGGSAADAAVAMYFAMAVTLPSAAGLGGGGACVYYDSNTNKAETVDFLARAPAGVAPEGRWRAAVPGSVRGMFALHARYGRLAWERVVRPAEAMARFGVPAPRALVRRLGGSPVLDDPRGRSQFGGADGRGLKETDTLQRVDLAGTLGRIRSAGAGELYTGALARAYVDGVAAIGGWIAIDDLRAFRPVWRETAGGRFGSHRVHFPPAPVTGGPIAAAIWEKLGDNSSFAEMDPGAQARLLVETARQAGAANVSPDAAGASAGFLAMDRQGSAAACAVTMNRPFGTGRIVPGVGFLAVPAAEDSAGVRAGLAPMVIANHNTRTAYMAATGAGGGDAPVALMTAVLNATGGDRSVKEALAAPRAAPRPGPGAAVVERAAPQAVKQAFSGAAETDRIGRVLMMYCPDGMAMGWRYCAVEVDPRGHGYAVNAER